MARNTQIAADRNAPPITQILARFVATHREETTALLAAPWKIDDAADVRSLAALAQP